MEAQAPRWIDADALSHRPGQDAVGRLYLPLWRWGRPLVIVTVDGKVKAWNAAAENFFRDEGRALLKQFFLAMPSEEYQDRLERALAKLAAPQNDRPELVAVPNLEDGVAIVLRLFPLAASPEGEARLAVQIEREDASYAEISAEFQHFYRLTPAEMRVARSFFRHIDVKAVADDLDCSPHTVKTHLKKIYAKVQAEGQLDLMKRLSKFAV